MKRLLYLFVLVTPLLHGQGPVVIAHRGGAGLAPENTLAAFQNAMEVGADYFELDVMISSDDSLMIMHDATVDRTTDGTGTVASMTFGELRALDAGSWFGAEFAGEQIPTLWESLDPTIAVQLFGTIAESHIDQVAAISGEWVGSGGTLTQEMIDYAHAKGISFNAWTLNAASTILPAMMFSGMKHPGP